MDYKEIRKLIRLLSDMALMIAISFLLILCINQQTNKSNSRTQYEKFISEHSYNKHLSVDELNSIPKNDRPD